MLKKLLMWTVVIVVLITVMSMTMIPKGRKDTETFNELCQECGYDKFTSITSIMSIESSANLFVYECGRNNFILTTDQNNILDCDIRNGGSSHSVN